MQEAKLEDLEGDQKDLLNAALKALENSYNPHSNFYVGAALLTDEGEIITGTNCENAVHGLAICAERAAIFTANGQGKRKFKSIAIIAKQENGGTAKVTSPCGACRQVIAEFANLNNQDIGIIMSTTDMSQIQISSINELLPVAFELKV